MDFKQRESEFEKQQKLREEFSKFIGKSSSEFSNYLVTNNLNHNYPMRYLDENTFTTMECMPNRLNVVRNSENKIKRIYFG